MAGDWQVADIALTGVMPPMETTRIVTASTMVDTGMIPVSMLGVKGWIEG